MATFGSWPSVFINIINCFGSWLLKPHLTLGGVWEWLTVDQKEILPVSGVFVSH
jgi:hypothetical protein